MLNFATRFQKSVALSSGEAELAAQVAGVAEGIGMQRVLEEMGVHAELVSYCDSSAARGVLHPRHVDGSTDATVASAS